MISQCLNPDCLHSNIHNHELCERCGAQLLLMNRYRAVSLLGQGSFGRTFLAIDELKPSKPRCVIKQFLPEVKGKKAIAKATELFEREAARLDELGQHEQIPGLLAFFDQEERKYLIQEYIDGHDLLKVLSKEGSFNQQQIKELLNDLLDVLKFVHQNNIIHRDIKPENIIRRKQDGKLVLVDFGAAKSALANSSSQSNTIIGSACYVAPEQAAGKPKFASDLYSLGATCLHLLTNIEPLSLFNTEEGEWNWRSHLQDNEIDYELSHVLDRLVEGATNRRFQSVEQVERALAGEIRPLIRTSQAKSRRNHSARISARNSIKKASSVKSPPRRKGKLDLKILEFQYSKIDNDPCVIMGKTVSLTTNRYGGKAKYITLQLAHEITIDLIGIPGGKFLMGSLEFESEREIEESPQHSVTVRPFLMGKYPITQAQWLAVMDDNPSRFLDLDPSRSKKPVERVSWLDCNLFCQKLSQLVGRDIRLPSEAEWEYACRGKTQTPFHCGSTISTELANYNGEEIYRSGIEGENRQQTTDVDTFAANPFGLYDLHGNVAEWCADTWHSNYQNAPADGSAWVSNNSKDQRVLRGGSWLHLPGSCRSAQRLKSSPQSKSDAFGFRIAASI
ncbi:MAG: bifunctional serine/threonine-protein kinase/formylglycine-generating enzyme family protein [Cyanobacteria bacterium J06621_12]